MKRYFLTSFSILALGAGVALAVDQHNRQEGPAAECHALARLAARYQPSLTQGDDRIGNEGRAYRLCVADPIAFKRLFHRTA